MRRIALALLFAGSVWSADQQLARSIFKQLIEINTTDSVGSTTAAAEAMKQRFLDAGFPATDLVALGPDTRKGNLVVRLRGKQRGSLKPVLIICHLDVVEARREDWTTDPFQFIEKDGYFYGRGTQDMKANDAVLIATLIRFKQERFQPNRDLILALTAGRRERRGERRGLAAEESSRADRCGVCPESGFGRRDYRTGEACQRGRRGD